MSDEELTKALDQLIRSEVEVLQLLDQIAVLEFQKAFPGDEKKVRDKQLARFTSETEKAKYRLLHLTKYKSELEAASM